MKRLGLLMGLAFICHPLLAGEWSGFIAVEGRAFANDPAYRDQSSDPDLSLAVQPEYYSSWDEGRQSFTFVPFVRLDRNDEQRSHVDIRELTWLKAAENWELRAGVRKLFWGVTESQHLVDIINQTDQVENLDGEDKLGQPMVNLALIRNWGTVDLFWLPYFRERTFAGSEGRLRTAIPVDDDQTQYESSAKQYHQDWAVRWSHYIGDWEVGLSHFSGTSRDPRLLAGSDNQGNPVLIPFYDQIDQTGLDLQLVWNGWLWKLEGIHRAGQGETYNAATAGFEYTLYGIFDSASDLGLISEYLYDSRGQQALSPFEDDIMMGLRWVWNDVQSTEFLFGVIQDRDSATRQFNLEASRRIGDSMKLSLESRWIENTKAQNLLNSLEQDDSIQLELTWYF